MMFTPTSSGSYTDYLKLTSHHHSANQSSKIYMPSGPVNLSYVPHHHRSVAMWNDATPSSSVLPEISISGHAGMTSGHVGTSLFHTHPIFAILLCTFVICLILATLIGNAMVCLAVFLVRKLKQQPANLLLVSLAIADFCVGLIVMPIGLVAIVEDRWILGEVVCRLWTSFDLVLCSASILNLCMISVDRYLVVSRPLRYSAMRTKKHIFVYIAIVWILALFVSVSPLIFLPWKKIDHVCQVPDNQWYQLYATMIAFYGPGLIMVVLYVCMWRTAKRIYRQDRLTTKWSISLKSEEEGLLRKKKAFGFHIFDHLQHAYATSFGPHEVKTQLNNNNESNGVIVCKDIGSNHAGTPQNNNNSNHVTAIIKPKSGSYSSQNGGYREHMSPRKFSQRPSAFFNAMRMPLMHSRSHEKTEDKARKTLGVVMGIFILCWLPFFIVALLKSQNLVQVPKWLDTLLLWLGYLNSTLNPLIYCKYNREFRVPFREMLCCRFSTLQDVMRHETFNSKYGPSRVIAQRKSSLLSQNGGGLSSNGGMDPSPCPRNSMEQI